MTKTKKNIEKFPLDADDWNRITAIYSMKGNRVFESLCRMQLDTISLQKKFFLDQKKKEELFNQIISDTFEKIAKEIL